MQRQILSYKTGQEDGIARADAYDTLQRHWPYSRTQRTPPLIEAATRMTQRRAQRPIPPRLAFKSTVDYYEALLPLMMAHQRWERTGALRYIRPRMIQVLLRHWPRDPLF